MHQVLVVFQMYLGVGWEMFLLIDCHVVDLADIIKADSL